MASITRIEVANFLSDGYVSGKEWMPLYRGETLRLFGQSAALQIDNGGGKTSLTEACLYLLSRNKKLKPRVEARVAPIDKGWTHIRIEFLEKPHDENILQSSLITIMPDEVPGTPYVIGLCWNRDKEPYFYHFQGLLEETPCYRKTENKLELIDNDTFRKSVEKIPGARWNTWHNIPEWHEDIRQFTNIEVLKQNVEFQLEGAGDYSAMVTKVKQKNGESYDEAFFRAIVAPELLRQPLGDEGDADEQKFEDALFKTLKPTADALVDIAKRQRDLDDATSAIIKFQPVEEKAQEVIEANKDYNNELNKVIRDAAIIHAIAVRHPIPGIPVVPPSSQWIKDKTVCEALSHLVIDKRHGVLITDEGLAAVAGIETRRLNEKARELELNTISSDSQVIDFKADLKDSASKIAFVGSTGKQAQVIDNRADLKESARGKHRKYGISCYNLKSAISLVNAAANFSGAHTSGLNDILMRAFGIAENEIDTNPYRKERHRLSNHLNQAIQLHANAKADRATWQAELERLLKVVREAEENEIAYQGFAARKLEFPEEYREAPLSAKAWAEDARANSQKALAEHIKRAGELKDGFILWNDLKSKHGIVTLPSALDDLINTFQTASAQDMDAKKLLKDARENHKMLTGQFSEKNLDLTTLQEQHQTLSGLAAYLPKFREIFGNVEPDILNPQKSLQDENTLLQANGLKLSKSNRCKEDIDALMPSVATFKKIFGESDPSNLNPLKTFTDHLGKIATEQQIMDEHLPYIEALDLFREMHPDQTPDEWLKKISEDRSKLVQEKGRNEEQVNELNGELADLDLYDAADDRVYAKALATLRTAGIPFKRLHETIKDVASGDRRQQLLTLFSAALSAPVVASIEDANQATKTLESARLTVPVFFKPALNQFAQHGEINLSGEVAHTFLVGRHTRQVEILINPALIAAEKVRIQTDIDGFILRNENIDTELLSISAESQPVKLAVSAKDAIKRDSTNKFNEAQTKFNRMNNELPSLELRASDDARKSIDSMKRYIEAGGDAGYRELVEVIIQHLDSEIGLIEARIGILNTQVTEEANRALLAAKDYKKHGGDTELNRLTQEVGILEPQVLSLVNQIQALSQNISNVLEADEEKYANKFDELKKTYFTDKQQLEIAITFESTSEATRADKVGNVEFMQNEQVTHENLEGGVETGQLRLEGIDFDRANSYIKVTESNERSPADQLADAEAKRNQSKLNEEKAQCQIDNLSGQIAALLPWIESLHEMVVAIRSQHAKIAIISDDIRQRMQMEGAVHPEILGYAENIRLACMGDRASTSDEARAAITNLKAEVEELKIDTKHLLTLSNVRTKTRAEFGQRRQEFCDKAKSGEIKGLTNLEIEEIEKATTLEQLISIHELKSKIEAQVKEHEVHLQKIREFMESNKAATVNNLAHFARQAILNLGILDKVMKRKPNARFIVKTDIVSEERIRQIIESLIAEIEDRESSARERTSATLNDDIERRNIDYKEMIHAKIYRDIFVNPKVSFVHTAIRDGETLLTAPGTGISTGQHTALAMMWLVRQAEYAQDRVVMLSGTRKEQRAAMKGSQRLMFFDGLFSNLSNEDYIDAAFEGLKDVGDNFQLIGLIHNPYYVNNKDIFPVHLVGKRKLAKHGDKKRAFVAVEPWQEDNGMIHYTSAYKHNSGGDHAKS